MAIDHLALHGMPDRPLLAADKPSTVVVEWTVSAPTLTYTTQRLPLNLALVLDRSGSMHGKRWKLATAAAIAVLEALDERDRVAVVAFDDEVSFVTTSEPVTVSARERLKARINQVGIGGNTNLGAGWLHGLEEVAAHQQDTTLNRVLLISDGKANRGIVNPKKLATHAAMLQMLGITTSTFGIGERYNESLLDQLSAAGGGNFHDIATADHIADEVFEELGRVLTVVARQTYLTLTFPAGMTFHVWGELPFEQDGNQIRVLLSTLSGGEKRRIYLALDATGSALRSSQPVQAELAYTDLEGRTITVTDSIDLHYVPMDTVVSTPLDTGVRERAGVVVLASNASQAIQLERKGKVAAAQATIRTALDTYGTWLTPDDRQTYTTLLDEMGRRLTEYDRKRTFYRMKERQLGREDQHDNRQALQFLFDHHEIPIQRGWIFDSAPGPMPRTIAWKRIEGMLLGLAIGDALGNTTEGRLPGERQARYGEIHDYLPAKGMTDRRGYPSDDTQLAFWTLEQLLKDGGLIPEHVAARFRQQRIYGIGQSVKEFIRASKEGKEPWYRWGAASAGNGALMRIAPVLLPHLRTGTSALWADSALAATITHRDPASISACIALVNLLWEALQRSSPPEPAWWLNTYVEVARELEGATSYRPRGGAFMNYQGTLWQFVEEHVSDAYARDLSVEEASNRWFSGAYLLETVPSVLYILMRHGHEPEEAIIRAVNDTKDNDTIAAIVGAAVGALHGTSRLPQGWVTNLSGRTAEHDDGRIFELIEEAHKAWWH